MPGRSVSKPKCDQIGLELGAKGKWQYHVEEDDPLSAVAELQRTQTMSRDAWQIRIETQMRSDRPRIGRKGQMAVSRRGGRSAQCSRRAAAHPDNVARCLADPYRNPNAIRSA